MNSLKDVSQQSRVEQLLMPMVEVYRERVRRDRETGETGYTKSAAILLLLEAFLDTRVGNPREAAQYLTQLNRLQGFEGIPDESPDVKEKEDRIRAFIMGQSIEDPVQVREAKPGLYALEPSDLEPRQGLPGTREGASSDES